MCDNVKLLWFFQVKKEDKNQKHIDTTIAINIVTQLHEQSSLTQGKSYDWIFPFYLSIESDSP